MHYKKKSMKTYPSRRNQITALEKFRKKTTNLKNCISDDLEQTGRAITNLNMLLWVTPVAMIEYSNPIWAIALPFSLAGTLLSLPVAGIITAKNIIKDVYKTIKEDIEEKAKDDEKRIGYFASNLADTLSKKPPHLPVLPKTILAKISLFAAAHPAKSPDIDPSKNYGPDFELALNYIKKPEQAFLSLK
ncbi:hypothetical protein [Legionella pneumophila]|uniref:hypothetical protein n=1 Tax=Legionella pneumophila TaxID=446 RepID=UPI0005C4319B|nr:hypothetical protein [Legionella pneumophila]GAN30047.1 hypothetical protein lpymt_01644 [Legionella pneumophila]